MKLHYPESLFDAYSYNKETGIFSHKKKLGVKEGSVSGCDNGKGYLRVTHKKKQYYAHRLAWFFVYGDIPESQIDHINGNTKDNRISNLRLASPSQNMWNLHSHQSNSDSKELGVSWHKKAQKWQSFFKNKYLGLFGTLEEAKIAYQREKQKNNPFVEAV